MNGNSMEWNNSYEAKDEGLHHSRAGRTGDCGQSEGRFLHRADLDTGRKSDLFLGSFQDNGADSQLQFIYNGGKDSKLTLHSIRTSLKTTGSGMIVESGTLALAYTHTVHGQGRSTAAAPSAILMKMTGIMPMPPAM